MVFLLSFLEYFIYLDWGCSWVCMWKLKFNLKPFLSTAALHGQTTKTAQKAETCTPKRYLMQDWLFRLGSDIIKCTQADLKMNNFQNKIEHT